ncbi:MAG: nucleoside hydrolase [candidate division KSB1 bacterium]|nr:nucleoside hydrolase [candidate division KSB1 bacterium]
MKAKFVILLVLGLSSIQVMGAEKQKIIFDCDLGGDVDDAYAVALVLSSPEFEVLGLVMDNGNTPARGRVACRLLYETGMTHIPVVLGRQTDDSRSHQFDWADGFDKIKPIKQSGSDFIIEQLNQYPGEIILFTVGPVTNIKDIIDKDPQALKKVKHIYSMFGSFYVGYGDSPIPTNEWNVRADVEASNAFVSSGAPVTYAGLDITHIKLTESYRERLNLRESPLTNAVDALYTLWRYEDYAQPDPTLFDVAPVAMVLWPELFQTRPAYVDVVGEGYTVVVEGRDPNCEIGMSVNKDELLKRVTKRLLKQNLNRW